MFASNADREAAEKEVPMRKTVPQKVVEFLEKEPRPAEIYANDIREICQTGSIFNIINTAFYYGYIKGVKSKRGGVGL